jgi:putative aminopeptidase FrvX
MEYLKKLQSIHAPAGEEQALSTELLNYIAQNKANWKVMPTIYSGKGFQDCIVLVFGKPRTAIFAHMDSIGFTVRYGDELVKIGGPRTHEKFQLIGKDSTGEVEAELNYDEERETLCYKADREIERGTSLVFKPNWRETEDYVQNCYMDNRLGVWNALQVAETLEDGIVCFSAWEEHGGGAVEYLGKFVYEEFGVSQALISDITWVTEGVKHGEGCAISLRDSGLPRKSYVQKIVAIAKESGVAYQLEVEGSGGSDGNGLQRSSYPWDWCFVGAPEDHVHSPNEKVFKSDIKAMTDLYKVLMKSL